MKKLLLLTLALSLALSLLSLPASAEGPVIALFGIGATIPETDQVIPELEKRLGIDLNLENMTADNAALTTRIASGDIPDIFRIPDLNMISTFYDNGVLLNVRDYLDDMPHVKEVFTNDYWGPLTFDGGYYAIPRRAQVNYMSWYVRADWLEALNLAMPTTLDEVLEIAKAMNAADFDGNGKADTYAISGAGISSRSGAFNGFFTAYGVTNPKTIMIRDNQAVYACTTEEFKLAIEDIRRFVEAGVVDPEIVSNNMDALREKAASGKTGIVYTGWTEYSKQAYHDILVSVYPDAKWQHFELPIATPYGVSGAIQTAVNYSFCYGLSADLADDPAKLDAVLKMLDYITYGEGDLLMSYGVEGVHFVKDGDKIVKQPAMNDLTYGWALQITGRDDMVYCMTKFDECADEIEYAATEIPMYYHYEGFVQQPEGINVADLKSYEEEQLTQFIFGGRDMAEWDKFIETLYSSYNLGGYMESATEQLTALGYLK
ncbi:MAG TPA: extracellular solute-binding protein [Clostridia bacterium]|nr:extracellular solute-binding protein [Clostridia bacterium]